MYIPLWVLATWRWKANDWF